jgi:16S rRNA (guanine(966)-N(2))-methyltransferase RsmD
MIPRQAKAYRTFPLRIIAGLYRGRQLKSPPSLEVRPTSDRLRETLFNILAPLISDTRFLDLCAGSGAVGIEALSRSAAHASFVDRSRKICGLIESNLDLCRIPEDQTEVFNSEAKDFLHKAIERKMTPWDIVYFDPPYQDDYLRVLNFLGAHTDELLASDGRVIVEHYHKNQLPDILGGLERTRIVKQGDASMSFYGLRMSDML